MTTTITVAAASKHLSDAIDYVSKTHEPIQIVGARSSAILIAEDDWRSIQETLFLMSIPGMRESLHGGMKAPTHECDESPEW